MNISVILGTRPEVIKMSPVIRECERKGVDYFILHKCQHYFCERKTGYSLRNWSCFTRHPDAG